MSGPALLLLFLIGVFLSAFFSGSETGFYRVTRVRLALDGLGGDFISRGLLWLTNNPSLFVATTLIGNNLANYITSLSIVLAARQVFGGRHFLAELLAPIVLSPVLFIYGELLPKNLFYMVPNYLLRKCGPLFIVCGIVFAPVSALLWMLGRCLQWIMGEAPEYVRLRLAREELQQMLEEGREAGVLRPAQSQLAQGLFSVATRPITQFCVPTARYTSVTEAADRSDVLRIARRHRSAIVLVTDKNTRRPKGYVRTIDLCLHEGDWTKLIRPIMRLNSTETQIEVLIKMQTGKEAIALVLDDSESELGIINVQRLTESLRGT